MVAQSGLSRLNRIRLTPDREQTRRRNPKGFRRRRFFHDASRPISVDSPPEGHLKPYQASQPFSRRRRRNVFEPATSNGKEIATIKMDFF
jgi:hypothetical protein